MLPLLIILSFPKLFVLRTLLPPDPLKPHVKRFAPEVKDAAMTILVPPSPVHRLRSVVLPPENESKST